MMNEFIALNILFVYTHTYVHTGELVYQSGRNKLQRVTITKTKSLNIAMLHFRFGDDWGAI